MGLPVVKASFNVAHGGEDRATVQQVAEQIERRGDWLAAGRPTRNDRKDGRSSARRRVRGDERGGSKSTGCSRD
jgi:hypothetical protein